MTSPAPGAAPEFVRRSIERSWPFDSPVRPDDSAKAEARRQHATPIQDVPLPGSTLDAEDVSSQEGVLDS